jgi:hypothetical protein
MQINKCRALMRLKKYKEAAEAYDLAYKIDAKWAVDAQEKESICRKLAANNFQPEPCL